ncbi:hypothetical protein ACQKGO_16270 [Corallococcus interemptor]|uniref:hypothetical protein n=1 Tax=Corallococcus interemptor TaxID=2316720 RepID=UPI003D05CCA0
MTTQIQLHALPQELLELASQLLASGGLFAAVVRIWPELLAEQVQNPAQLNEKVSGGEMPFRICISETPFDLTAKKLQEFVERNSGLCCFFDIGKLSGEGLRQSRIVVMGGGEDVKRWTRFVRETKKIAHVGLWVVNPMDGARGLSKTSRYTDGAADYFKKGGKLLAVGGWNYCEVEDG